MKRLVVVLFAFFAMVLLTHRAEAVNIDKDQNEEIVKTDSLRILTLTECYKLAIENSTISKKNNANNNISINDKKEAFSVFVPSVSLNGYTSYQSDVIGLDLPNIDAPRKGNYSITLDLEQVIYDGGAASKKKDIITSDFKAETLKLDIAKLGLKDKVASLYLGMSLLKQNEKVLDLNIEILVRNLKKMKNLFENGAGQKSDYLQLQSELLKADQSLNKIKSDEIKVAEMLSVLLGKSISAEYKYLLPSDDFNFIGTSQRPEYDYYDVQGKIIDENIKLLQSKNLPKFSFFATGGNGLPGLNLLNRSPDWYYKAGLKLSVPLTGWKSTRYKKLSLDSHKSLISDSEKDFSLSNEIQISSAKNMILKYRNMIYFDKKIVAIKKELADIEEAKLQRGIITSSEYITELNKYKESMLSQKLNEIKLIQSIINYKSAVGLN
ncbi:MAG: TolC family protein [Prolixibacteraceae bacterium]|nr:TolC family protein [Prolixibacteraceae bacterium]